MKYIFVNDRTDDLIIHPASDTIGVAMRPGAKIEVTLTDGSVPFIKIWDDMVLLSNKPEGEE